MSSVSEWARIVCVNVPGDEFITIGIIAWDTENTVGAFTNEWDKIAAFHAKDSGAVRIALENVQKNVEAKRFFPRDVEKLRKLTGPFRMMEIQPSVEGAVETLARVSKLYFNYVKPFYPKPLDTGDF